MFIALALFTKMIKKIPGFSVRAQERKCLICFSARGGIPKWARRAIVKGNVYVVVTVYAIDGIPTSLER